jgi:hypothetical protein
LFKGGEMKIKFSHHYVKMPPDFKVSRLWGVSIIYLEDTESSFLEKDTEIVGGGHYPLPKKGKFMVLWLESSIMNIRWQTIRRWTPQKHEYYQDFIGKLVECEIVDEQ